MTAFASVHFVAVLLGSMHALEVDHLAAVSTFVVQDGRVSRAVSFGVRWALAHTCTILVVGSVVAFTGLSLPAWLIPWNEGLVGVVLVAIGGWIGARAWRFHRAGAFGALGRAPVPGATGVAASLGLLHGLAGAAPAVALVPVAMIDDPWQAVGYLLAFGVGTVVGMGVYAGAVAVALRRTATGRRSRPWVTAGVAAVSVITGLLWIARSVAGAG